MVVRKNLQDKELENLKYNLEKSQHLIDHSKENMVNELRMRDEDWRRVMEETKQLYNNRINSMKEDNDKSIAAQKGQIDAVEKEIDSKIPIIICYSLQQ